MTSYSLKADFSSGAASWLWARVRAGARQIQLWSARAESRRTLRLLDAHLLKDIGLTPRQALEEAAKPFWIR